MKKRKLEDSLESQVSVNGALQQRLLDQDQHCKELHRRNGELDQQCSSLDQELRKIQGCAQQLHEENRRLQWQIQRIRETNSRALELEKKNTERTLSMASELERKIDGLERQISEQSFGGSYSDSSATPTLFEAALAQANEAIQNLASVLPSRFLAASSVVFARPLHRKIAVRAALGDVFFAAFEAETFGLDGGFTEFLDPEELRRRYFQEFQACPEDRVEVFAAAKMEELRGKIPGFDEAKLGSQFEKVALSVWKLHRLAFSFYPAARILRVATGRKIEPAFMDSVITADDLEEDEDDEERLAIGESVAFSVLPGFTIRKTVFKSQVYPVLGKMVVAPPLAEVDAPPVAGKDHTENRKVEDHPVAGKDHTANGENSEVEAPPVARKDRKNSEVEACPVAGEDHTANGKNSKVEAPPVAGKDHAANGENRSDGMATVPNVGGVRTFAMVVNGIDTGKIEIASGRSIAGGETPSRVTAAGNRARDANATATGNRAREANATAIGKDEPKLGMVEASEKDKAGTLGDAPLVENGWTFGDLAGSEIDDIVNNEEILYAGRDASR
ncbi:hypothetical protein SELMODRAFT_416826 [Selaginella moellendorffii]|uniref:GIL1/IRKI C-terminal domain-containing protein n=1 Tax=Selaginella moellendorffii TaxID=88036 RepID=D8S0I8_SELML|nr:hypothetical protein SELMODRAFT_416826 [Selaginella moellendorffii]